MPDTNTQSPQTNAPRCFALLPCAGSGSRAGTATPKQYQPLAGLPLVLHTLAALQAVQRVLRCLVVVAPGDRFLSVDHPDVQVLPCGASSRAGSVFNGLQALLAHQVEALSNDPPTSLPQMRGGAVRALDDTLLFDRALESVLGNLRRLNRGK